MRASWPGGGGAVGDRSRRILLATWALIGLAMLVSLVGASPSTLLARLFFALVFLLGAGALATGLGGRAPVAVAAVLLALVVMQRVVDRPVAEPPSSQWTRALERPGQTVQHEIALPLGSAAWDAAWSRATAAYAFVCARSPLDVADGLELIVNDVSLGTITEAHAFGPRPGPTFVGFYRLPVERSLLERRHPAVFVVRRREGASPRPIPICGTFSYRPTAGIDSSRFFDGATWWRPGPAQGGRFVVELRLEDAGMRPVWVAY